MNRRTFLAIKSRPLPLVALLGLAGEVVVVMPHLGYFADWAMDVSMVLAFHVLASLITGLSFPGWYGRRGERWGVAASEASPAVALEPPAATFTVPEVAGAEENKGEARGGEFDEERRAHHRLGPMMMGISLCFPVLGAGAALIIATLRRAWSDDYAALIREYRQLVDINIPVLDLPPDVRTAAAERTWQAMELRPFVEIIGAQEREDEIAVSAIESTAALEYPVASRLLRYALASTVPETRYYAAKALARIEETLDRELKDAQEAHNRRPNDPGPMVRIADARLSYGEVGQADDPLNRFHLTEAIRFYRMCLDKVDRNMRDDTQARLAVAALRVGDLPAALQYYTELVDRGSRVVSVLQGCVETCYLSGDYEKLRYYLRIAVQRCPESDLVKEVSRVWLAQPGS